MKKNNTRTILGIENFINNPEYKNYRNKKLGLVTNQSAILPSGTHTWDTLLASGYSVGAFFGPEHGFRGDAQDAVKLNDTTYRDIPVYSLYGARYKPETYMLKGLDVLIFDIQDVGSRYYTYLYTLAYSLEAAAENNIEFVVTDRPNPIGLTSTYSKAKTGISEERIVEGFPIDNDFESFVGGYGLPNRYGLTIGEFALYIKDKYYPDAKLTVIPMENYNPSYFFEDTNLPWVMPSPNIPTPTTALVYAGTCLVEGTNLSEGRGTTRPFEIIGAPWIDGDSLREKLMKEELPGVVFSSTFFTPQFSKHAGKLCSGITIHVLDRTTYNPLLTAISVLFHIKRDYPKHFEWRADWKNPNEYFIDKLAGTDLLRKMIDSGADSPVGKTSSAEDSTSENPAYSAPIAGPSKQQNSLKTPRDIFLRYNRPSEFKKEIKKYLIY